jgi:hypothetical protein
VIYININNFKQYSQFIQDSDFIELNQLTGVAAILNFPLPDIVEEEENEQAAVVETT